MRATKRSNLVYAAIVRLLFLKYLWVHFLVVTIAPLAIVERPLTGSVSTFIVLWFALSASLTWSVSRWPPLDSWYRENAAALAGRGRGEDGST